jgi:hypothetical protein
VTTAEDERRIELAIAALRLIDVYTPAELEQARQRMRRIDDQRIAGGSGG